MNARETILERLHKACPEKPTELPRTPADDDVFADMPEAETLIECFAERLSELSAEFYRMKSFVEIAATFKELIDGNKFMSDDSSMVEAILQDDYSLEKLRTRIDDVESPESIEFGVTSARILVARTGSIVLDCRSAGGRRLSVLPPAHIVIASANQVTQSLDDAFAHINDNASYATIITGPSRTADIEKILVLGAHGPKRLIVLLLDD